MWFIGCAEEGEHTEKLPVVGACVLQAVVDMEALITFLIQAGIQSDIIRQEITLPDQFGFAGIAVPEKFVFMNGLQLTFFCDGEALRGIDRIKRGRLIRRIWQKDCGITAWNDESQAGKKDVF